MTNDRPAGRFEAFFFDFDGVLADSVTIKGEAFAKLFEAFGREIMERVREHHHAHGGMTRREKIGHYYRNFLNKSLDDQELEKLCSRFSVLVVDAVVQAPAIAGSAAFLDKWHERVPCFIVSATPDDELAVIVNRRRLTRFFREILGSSRPKAENLAYLLDKYGLDPGRCLFFGDAMSDYQAASRTGVPFVGILPGPEAPLATMIADIVWFEDFDRFDEVYLDAR